MDTATLEKAIADSLEKFHKQRLLAAQKLRALRLLSRKNPYLYRALGYEIAAELMSALLESQQEFDIGWAAIVNRLTMEFSELFCLPDGRIDWERLTAYVSATIKPTMPKKRKASKTVPMPGIAP